MGRSGRIDATPARRIQWVRAALKDFQKFPDAARTQIATALDLAADGLKADIAKPMRGLGAGVMEIALEYRTNAYRAIYALRLGDDIWVIHAFQKKSKTGRKTPKQDVEKITGRIKALRKDLKNEQKRKN